jgi:acyl-CoA reductase-like NAD-dependent aldehyde dehydrogenase
VRRVRALKEEMFGPVLSVVRSPDFERPLRLVNDHEYGNGAGTWGTSTRPYRISRCGSESASGQPNLRGA